MKLVRVVIFATLFITPFAQAETVVIRAARMIDVRGGEVIAPAVVVVKDNRIASINPDTIPEGEIIELGDRTLLPGLMDMHVHLHDQLGHNGSRLQKNVTYTSADFAVNAVVFAEKTLLAGFTTVRQVGGPDYIDVALSVASDKNRVAAPRIVPGGYSLGTTGGHCDHTAYAPGILEQSWRQGVADGVDEVVKAVRYQIKHGAKVIKFCATAGVLSFEEAVGAQQYSAEEMSALITEAHRHDIPVAAHAHGTEGIKTAIRAGVDSIEHGSMLDDEAIRLLKRHGTFLVPTSAIANLIPLDGLPPQLREKAHYIIPRARDSLRKAIAAGVKVALGTDAAVIPHGENAAEFIAMTELGMSNAEALRTATVNSAELLGVTNRGELKANLLADIIAVDDNPLENISTMQKVSFVMKDGIVYKRPTK